MGFSISRLTNFENINWHNFEHRPPIMRDMPLCSSFNWEYDIPCCTDPYVIGDTLQMATRKNKSQTKEAIFLSNYPCVNSLEFEEIVDKMFEANSLQGINTDKPATFWDKISEQFQRLF